MKEIHTSDRILFKRCRRKWNWSSPLRKNLIPKFDIVEAFWIGTGFHFALEDLHGYKLYNSVSEAWDAYVDAHTEAELPENYTELSLIFKDILTYYVEEWEPFYFNNFKTTWVQIQYNDEEMTKWDVFPATELKFHIKLPYGNLVYPNLWYSGTIDRIVEDEYNRLWVVDYKTAKQFDVAKLETDPQVAAYTWASYYLFGKPIEGVMWVQFRKERPKYPKQLLNGEFSQDKKQLTTSKLYQQALIEHFGKIPEKYIDYISYLVSQESEFGNKFIRYDRVRKNEQSIVNEERKIFAEIEDIINPSISLYPNPTRDCNWDCQFRSACIANDDGADYKFILESNFEARIDNIDWKDRIDYPTKPDFYIRPDTFISELT